MTLHTRTPRPGCALNVAGAGCMIRHGFAQAESRCRSIQLEPMRLCTRDRRRHRGGHRRGQHTWNNHFILVQHKGRAVPPGIETDAVGFRRVVSGKG
jgi:hypothetical protein